MYSMDKRKILPSTTLFLFNALNVHAGEYSNTDGLTSKGNTLVIIFTILLFVGFVLTAAFSSKKDSDSSGCVVIAIIAGVILFFIIMCSWKRIEFEVIANGYFIQQNAYFIQIKPFLFDILTKTFKFAQNSVSEQQSTDHIECQRACKGKTWEDRLCGVRW